MYTSGDKIPGPFVKMESLLWHYSPISKYKWTISTDLASRLLEGGRGMYCFGRKNSFRNGEPAKPKSCWQACLCYLSCQLQSSTYWQFKFLFISTLPDKCGTCHNPLVSLNSIPFNNVGKKEALQVFHSCLRLSPTFWAFNSLSQGLWWFGIWYVYLFSTHQPYWVNIVFSLVQSNVVFQVTCKLPTAWALFKQLWPERLVDLQARDSEHTVQILRSIWSETNSLFSIKQSNSPLTTFLYASVKRKDATIDTSILSWSEKLEKWAHEFFYYNQNAPICALRPTDSQ